MTSSCCSFIPLTYISWIPLIYYYALSFIFPKITALVALGGQIVLIIFDCLRKSCSSTRSEFPKHLDCFLCIMFLALLIIAYAKENWIGEYNPIYVGLMLAVYSLVSVIIGRPFCSQFCQALVPEREWKNKTFLAYTRCNTIMWFILFLVCAASGAAAAGNYEKIEEDHLQTFLKYILPPIAFAIGLIIDFYTHSKVKRTFKDTDIFSHLDSDTDGRVNSSSSNYF